MTDWKDRIVGLGCTVCRQFSLTQRDLTTLHHVREGQGMSQKADDYLVVPLCREHHQGASGWHGLGRSGFYLRYKADEMDLLAWTLRALDKDLEQDADLQRWE